MFSLLRNRFGIPGVISVIALVFAMLGGAYAASNNSGGGKATASAKAKRGPRGPKGPAGPAGQTGPAGPAGAKGDTGAAGSNGANGEKGEKGEKGANGTNGTNGTNGKNVVTGTEATGTGNCEGRGGATVEVSGEPATKKFACNGKQGEPWTAGGTLPVNATETGGWLIKDAGVGVGEFALTAISFTLPLAAALNETHVQSNPIGFPTGANATEIEHCPGSVTQPKAKSGFLCVYEAALEHALGFVAPGVEDFGAVTAEPGTSTAGAQLLLLAESSAVFGSGTWAVTG